MSSSSDWRCAGDISVLWHSPMDPLKAMTTDLKRNWLSFRHSGPNCRLLEMKMHSFLGIQTRCFEFTHIDGCFSRSITRSYCCSLKLLFISSEISIFNISKEWQNRKRKQNSVDRADDGSFDRQWDRVFFGLGREQRPLLPENLSLGSTVLQVTGTRGAV